MLSIDAKLLADQDQIKVLILELAGNSKKMCARKEKTLLFAQHKLPSNFNTYRIK